MSQGRPRLTAVIMTYNCAHLLPKAYHKIPKDLVDDILVVDDGSKDDAAGAAKALGLECHRNPVNLGYGGNLKAGLEKALARGADYVVEVHGDGQFDPSTLREAMPLILAGTDFIMGSRFVVPGRARQNGMPLPRFLANRALSAVDRLVLGLPFTEFHSGFRVYSRRLLETVPWKSNSNDYLFSFQIIAQAAYAGLKVGEVPVEADYIGDHTSVGGYGASLYALQTFAVLAQYLMARGGLWNGAVFPRRAS
jgi:glycosyltransferase involved in cell wall biosynthesis